MARNRIGMARLAALPWTSIVAVAIPLLSAAIQLWLGLSGDDTPVWLAPLESLGVTLLALVAGLWLMARSVRDTRARADHFHVGEALAVGYGLNFLQPTGHRLRPDMPIGRLLSLSDNGDGQPLPTPTAVQRMLVALPGRVDELDNASIVGLRRELQARLGAGWWIGSARLSEGDAAPIPPGPDTLAGKPAGVASSGNGTGRGVGVTAVVHRGSGATVLIDLPSTLTVVPHFASFVAGQELDGSPWANELVAAARADIVRRFEAAKFAQVLRDGLDGSSPGDLTDTEPSAEDLLRLRLGPLRDRLSLVPMAATEDVGPLVDAVRAAARTLSPGDD
jgi:hypothetical protein